MKTNFDDPIAIMQSMLDDPRPSDTDLRMALAIALSALKVAKASNDSTARQIAAARKTATDALRRAA